MRKGWLKEHSRGKSTKQMKMNSNDFSDFLHVALPAGENVDLYLNIYWMDG